MSSPLQTLALSLGLTSLLWLLSLRLKDASIIDIWWGPGVALLVDLAAYAHGRHAERTLAVLLLVNIWALRLAAHIFIRHAHIGEDHRYAAMRRKFGKRWWWVSLLQVFLLQGILIWFIAAPPVAAIMNGRMPMGWIDIAGIILAGLGVAIEALADFQLARFRGVASNTAPSNTGQVMDRGLWGWSRHPNYFGEALMWWGYFAVGFGASHAWWLILSPLLVTGLLLKVSGITLMEDGIEERRPAYAAYKKQVSAFIPLPPQRVRRERSEQVIPPN